MSRVTDLPKHEKSKSIEKETETAIGILKQSEGRFLPDEMRTKVSLEIKNDLDLLNICIFQQRQIEDLYRKIDQLLKLPENTRSNKDLRSLE